MLSTGHNIENNSVPSSRHPGGLEPNAGYQWVWMAFSPGAGMSTRSGSLPMHKAASPSVSLRTCFFGLPDPGSSWSTTCCLNPAPVQLRVQERNRIWVPGSEREPIQATECASHWPWAWPCLILSNPAPLPALQVGAGTFHSKLVSLSVKKRHTTCSLHRVTVRRSVARDTIIQNYFDQKWPTLIECKLKGEKWGGIYWFKV